MNATICIVGIIITLAILIALVVKNFLKEPLFIEITEEEISDQLNHIKQIRKQ